MIEIKRTTATAASWTDLAADIDKLQTGDEIELTLKNHEWNTLVVAHDKYGKAYFIFKDCLMTRKMRMCFNRDAPGWNTSDIRDYLQLILEADFPDELQNLIEPVRIVQVVNGQEVASEDKLFLLSATQIDGRFRPQEPYETQLDIFINQQARKKRFRDCGAHNWWLRTPDGDGYCEVDWRGDIRYNDDRTTYGGIVPAFRLRRTTRQTKTDLEELTSTGRRDYSNSLSYSNSR